MHAGTTERVGADANLGVADDVKVDDRREVFDVAATEVVGLHAARLGAFHRSAAVFDDLVRTVRNPPGRVTVGRTPVRRVVLEPAVARRVVGRGDDDAVGLISVIFPVVGDDCVAEGRSRHVVIELVHQHANAVREEHLQGGRLGRTGEPVGVPADEEGAGDALKRAIFHDGLGDGRNVGFIEGRVERRATVARSAEGDLLGGICDIRNQRVIRGHQFVHIDEVGFKSGLASASIHVDSLAPGRAGMAIPAGQSGQSVTEAAGTRMISANGSTTARSAMSWPKLSPSSSNSSGFSNRRVISLPFT